VQVQAAVDLPIIKDKLAIRLAFDATRGNGYITNINTNNTLGDKNNRSGRATILFTPTETIKNVTIFQHDRVRGTEGVGGIFNDYSLLATPGVPSSQFVSDGRTRTPNTTGTPLSNTLAAIYSANDGPAGPGFFPGAVEGYAKVFPRKPVQDIPAV